MEESTLKFTWKIKGFSKIQTQKLFSDVFSRGPYKWKLLVHPKGGGEDHLSEDYFSIYLGVADETLPTGCCRNAKFSFTVVNQFNNRLSRTRDGENGFGSYFSGFSSFISLKDLHDPRNGFLVEDTCIIGVHVTIYGDVFMESHGESKDTSGKVVPAENSTEQDMDAFFLELQSVISAKRVIPSEEEAKEALEMIEEALNMAPSDLNIPGRMSQLTNALDILSSLKDCTILTPEQKAELLSLRQSFIDSPEQAAKAIKDMKLYTQNELVMPILDWKLMKCLIEFEKAKAETMHSEQNIAILQEQVNSHLAQIGKTKKKIESSSLKQKEMFKLSKEVKDELDVLVKNWAEYEAKKKAAEEDEKIVATEWDKMRQLVTSLALKKPPSPSMDTYWDRVKQLVLSLKKPFYPSL